MRDKNNRYMGSVKVGQKGQIVIPKEVREMFDIKPGDSLLLLADQEKGIAIERMSVYNKIADAIFDGRSKDIYPKNSKEESEIFANEIKKLSKQEIDEDDSK
ncbi:MAG: AbrB/MazE/SpoVT family DNA-binding domain-containing protein [Sphaerochaeta sp.]